MILLILNEKKENCNTEIGIELEMANFMSITIPIVKVTNTQQQQHTIHIAGLTDAIRAMLTVNGVSHNLTVISRRNTRRHVFAQK